MNPSKTSIYTILERVLPWLILAILLLFTYAKFFQVPYIGFRWDSSGQVVFIFTDGTGPNPPAKPGDGLLQENDRLLQASDISWQTYKGDLRHPFIDHVQPGDIIQLRIERDGQQITIPWVIPGPNPAEINDRIWTEAWLGLAFWILGTLTFLAIRPRNERWRLLVAFNFLTAIWLTVGSGLSLIHFWESAILLRIFVWFSVPVYLHLHWVFPRPLGKLHPAWVGGAYLLAALCAIVEELQLTPANFYYFGFLFAIVGSFILLLAHFFRQPEVRRELRSLLIIAFLSFAPSIVIGILASVTTLPSGLGGLGLLSLPLVPIAYFYTVLRTQLSGLELRFNQALSVYLYTIFLLVLLLPVIVGMNIWVTGTGSGLVVGIVTLLLAALITIPGYWRVQAFVERAILGVSLPPRDLLELYSEHIVTSTSFSSLQKLLETEILPRLHIRQFAFIQLDRNSPKVLTVFGLDGASLPLQDVPDFAISLAGKYRPVDDDPAPFSWVRLALVLKLEGELVGLWLFGRRDPDDFYAQAEINLLQSLANQTAIALSNILQTQRVLEMYQQDISRHEQERMRLALDLHDSILNQMAAMLLNMDDQAITPRFQQSYDELTQRLREIVSDLRPPMLNYGLKPALDELAESLAEREQNKLHITLDIRGGESRYPVEVEQHLFRIIQEAAENALRHGSASQITIQGELFPGTIEMTIADNGRGFDASLGFELAGLLANQQPGLAGMLERARLIGGDVTIVSQPNIGTTVGFKWAASTL